MKKKYFILLMFVVSLSLLARVDKINDSNILTEVSSINGISTIDIDNINGEGVVVGIDIATFTTLADTITIADATIFCLGNSNSKIYLYDSSRNVKQYSITDINDFNTISYDSKLLNISGINQNTTMTFNENGSKFFIANNLGDVFQYSLSTAWDVSTSSIDIETINIRTLLSTTSTLSNFIINENNNKLFACVGSAIYQFSIPDYSDISTVTYDSKSYNPFPDLGIIAQYVSNVSDFSEIIISFSTSYYEFSFNNNTDITSLDYTTISIPLPIQIGDIKFINSDTSFIGIDAVNNKLYRYSK